VKVIGLTGKAGAGKDTAAKFALEWCAERNINAKRFAFADPLKQSVAAAFNIEPHIALEWCNWLKQPGVFVTAERLEGEGDMPCEFTNLRGRRLSGRRFLQFFGTEAHRDVFGTDFWVEVTKHKLAQAELDQVEVAFLTDPRFDNEADMIHMFDGEVWELVRPGLSAVEVHASEDGLPQDKIDMYVNNVGNLEDLRDAISLCCEVSLEVVA